MLQNNQFLSYYVPPSLNAHFQDLIFTPVVEVMQSCLNCQLYDDVDGIQLSFQVFNEAFNQKNVAKMLQLVQHLTEYSIYVNYHPLVVSDADPLLQCTRNIPTEWEYYQE